MSVSRRSPIQCSTCSPLPAATLAASAVGQWGCGAAPYQDKNGQQTRLVMVGSWLAMVDWLTMVDNGVNSSELMIEHC